MIIVNLGNFYLKLSLQERFDGGEGSLEIEFVYLLKCHISHEVNHLHEGLEESLKSEL